MVHRSAMYVETGKPTEQVPRAFVGAALAVGVGGGGRVAALGARALGLLRVGLATQGAVVLGGGVLGSSLDARALGFLGFGLAAGAAVVLGGVGGGFFLIASHGAVVLGLFRGG